MSSDEEAPPNDEEQAPSTKVIVVDPTPPIKVLDSLTTPTTSTSPELVTKLNNNNRRRWSDSKKRTVFLSLLALVVLVATGVAVFVTRPEDRNDNNSESPYKISWPELVGNTTGEEAKSIIMEENPIVTNVVILPEGSMVTRDWNEYRVRIFVDTNVIVVEIPRVG